MTDRPTVAVQRPCIRARAKDCVNVGDVVQQAGAPREFIDTPLPWFDVWCTEHGHVERINVDDTDDDDVERGRSFTCYRAARHARDAHDGDVDRDGWS